MKERTVAFTNNTTKLVVKVGDRLINFSPPELWDSLVVNLFQKTILPVFIEFARYGDTASEKELIVEFINKYLATWSTEDIDNLLEDIDAGIIIPVDDDYRDAQEDIDLLEFPMGIKK